MGSIETGVRWKLGGNMALYTGVYVDYGFLNIIPAANGALCKPKEVIPIQGTPIQGTNVSTVGGFFDHNSILAAEYINYVTQSMTPNRYTDKVNSLAAGLKIKLAFGGQKKKVVPVVDFPPAPASASKPVPVSEPVKEVPQEIKQSMMKLSNTLFAFDKWNLTGEAVVELNKVVKWLNDNPDIRVQIDGHTDSMGSAEYNQRLSEDRAKSVYDYFVSHGVQASRLSYRGYGLTRPIADNATAEGRQQNRRAELQIIQ